MKFHKYIFKYAFCLRQNLTEMWFFENWKKHQKFSISQKKNHLLPPFWIFFKYKMKFNNCISSIFWSTTKIDKYNFLKIEKKVFLSPQYNNTEPNLAVLNPYRDRSWPKLRQVLTLTGTGLSPNRSRLVVFFKFQKIKTRSIFVLDKKFTWNKVTTRFPTSFQTKYTVSDQSSPIGNCDFFSSDRIPCGYR